MPPRVSVLLPVFNGATYLQAAIDSILQQSCEDFELLLFDDGSHDASPAIAQAAAAADPRLQFFRSDTNRGLGHTMTQLAALASGEFLAIQEQDDRSAPERLAHQIALLEDQPQVGLVSGLAAWVDSAGVHQRFFPGLLERGENYPQSHHAMVELLMVEQCKVVNAGAMFRRQVLQPAADQIPIFFDPAARMSVDWQFFIRLAHHWRIWGLPEVVVTMRRADDHASLTRQKALQFAEARRCLALLFAELGEDPRSPIDRRLYQRALATQNLLEARHGGLRAWRSWLAAGWYDPLRVATWQGLADQIRRQTRRVRAWP